MKSLYYFKNISKIPAFILSAFLIPIVFAGALNAKTIDFNKIQIIKNTCGSAGCMYEKGWIAKKDIMLRKENNINSPIVSIVNTKENIEALTGEVHVKPVKVIITRDYDSEFKYKKGEVIWLLNYTSGGVFNAFRNNKMTHIGFPFTSGKMQCPKKNKHNCWFIVQGKYEAQWWVKFKTNNGVIGWSNEIDNFDYPYDCPA